MREDSARLVLNLTQALYLANAPLEAVRKDAPEPRRDQV